MNYNDVFFLFLLGALVPVLVRTYLPRSLFSANFRSLVTLGGIAWLIYAMLWEVLSFELLGVAKADAAAHWFVGKRLAQQMDVVSWQVLVNHFHVGNNAYQCYVAAVHYFTGTSETFLGSEQRLVCLLGRAGDHQEPARDVSPFRLLVPVVSRAHHVPLGRLLVNNERERRPDVLGHLHGLQ